MLWTQPALLPAIRRWRSRVRRHAGRGTVVAIVAVEGGHFEIRVGASVCVSSRVLILVLLSRLSGPRDVVDHRQQTAFRVVAGDVLKIKPYEAPPAWFA